MTYNENKEDKKIMLEDLNSLKTAGLRVFYAHNNEYCYGLVSDGRNIINVDYEHGAVKGVHIIYVPSRTTGSCCSASEQEDIVPYSRFDTLEKFNNAVHFGSIRANKFKAKRYESIDAYFKYDKWAKNHYKEL